MFTWLLWTLYKVYWRLACLLFNLKMLSAYPQLRMADHWMSVLFMLLTPQEREIKVLFATDQLSLDSPLKWQVKDHSGL